MLKNSLRIIFMGTPEFAVPSLEAICRSDEEVVLVITQPDRRKGRGLKVSTPPVKDCAINNGLKIFQPESIKTREFIDSVKEISPDLIVVVAFGQILTDSLLAVPKMGTINVHPSLLPQLRGAAPIQRAIMEGNTATGVTTMLMTGKLDAGDILLSKTADIAPDETGGSLHDRLSIEGGTLLVQTIADMKAGTIESISQDDSRATYANRLKKEDGRVQWSEPADVIHNLARGLDPWPGAFTTLNGKRLMLFGSKPSMLPTRGKPGEFLGLDERGLHIAAGKGSVFIREVQLQGRKRFASATFLRGTQIKPGTILQSG